MNASRHRAAPWPRPRPRLADPDRSRRPAPTRGRPATGRPRRVGRRQPAVPDLAPVAGAYFAELPIGADPAQPRPAAPGLRRGGDGRAGALDPRGRPAPAGRGPPAPAPDAYELVMGERRWRAAQEAGLDTIPAIVRETDDADMLRDALLENLHRSQLNPLEEAAAYAPAARGLRLHPRGARPADRPLPAADQQHASGCSSSRRPSSAGSPPACSPPATPGRCSPSRTPTSRTGWPPRVVAEGISVRGLEEIVAVGRRPAAPRRRCAGASPTAPGLDRPRRAALRPARDPGQGRPRPAQGQDHRRVRLARRPAPDRRHHGPAQPRRPPDLSDSVDANATVDMRQAVDRVDKAT